MMVHSIEAHHNEHPEAVVVSLLECQQSVDLQVAKALVGLADGD
jgi:hypothetical protein